MAQNSNLGTYWRSRRQRDGLLSSGFSFVNALPSPLPAALVSRGHRRCIRREGSSGQKLGYFFYGEGPCRQRRSRNRKEYPLFLPSTQNRTLA
jgi:hypothetical protein